MGDLPCCLGSSSDPNDPFPEGATEKEMLEMIFRAIDKDGNEYVDLQEYTKLIGNAKDNRAKIKLKQEFRQADKSTWTKSKDSRLSLDEFVDFNLKNSKSSGESYSSFRRKCVLKMLVIEGKI